MASTLSQEERIDRLEDAVCSFLGAFQVTHGAFAKSVNPYVQGEARKLEAFTDAIAKERAS
jgi:hypothetical protein